MHQQSEQGADERAEPEPLEGKPAGRENRIQHPGDGQRDPDGVIRECPEQVLADNAERAAAEIEHIDRVRWRRDPPR